MTIENGKTKKKKKKKEMAKLCIFFFLCGIKGIGSKGNILNKFSDIKSNTYFCFADGEDTR